LVLVLVFIPPFFVPVTATTNVFEKNKIPEIKNKKAGQHKVQAPVLPGFRLLIQVDQPE